MGSSHHYSFAQLVDLVDGRLSADKQQQVRAHVAGCQRCAVDADWLERTIELMRTDRSEEPPALLVAGAIDLFRSRNSRNVPRKRLVGMLRFDSNRRLLVPRLRSGARLERQLMFDAEGFQLDLRILRAGSQWLVLGQVFGAAGGGQVRLQGAAGEAETDLNDLYEFRLPPVPAGSYDLVLYLENADIEIVGLEVGI
jgi:anti-sigma factor RsiW